MPTLLNTRRFLPLFIAQFLGAANDNFFKNAMLVLVVFRLAGEAGVNGSEIVNIAAALFILPFFLFSALAGQLADRISKSSLIGWIKLAEILIMGLGVAAFLSGDIRIMLAVLFLMGTQSAFFGPAKYAILPELLAEKELVAGNALIEAGTFLAILAGTIAAGLIILTDDGLTLFAVIIMILAVAGWAASRAIPATAAQNPDMKVSYDMAGQTFRILREAARNRSVFLSILGISWFWLVGATFLAQFPAFSRDIVGGDETVVTLFLTTFSVGIAIGSALCSRLTRGEISARLTPFGAIGITLFAIDLWLTARGLSLPDEGLISAAEFIRATGGIRLLVDLTGIAIAGGIFIVPLYAILQARSSNADRARMIAANNILNALFMVAGALAAGAALAAGHGITDLFLGIAVLNAVVALYVCRLMPAEMLRAVMQGILKILYRVRTSGLDNIGKAGPRAVIVVNHVSFLDGLLLATFLPGNPVFAINTHIARRWWVKPFLALVDAFPLDPTNPMAMKALVAEVKKDRHCVIFPEGRITVTGALMKVYEGPGLIADKADAMVIPVRIDGAQYTPLSRLKGKMRLRWFPKVRLVVLEPRRFELADDLVGRNRRRAAADKLYDVMSRMVFETCDTDSNLFNALLTARRIHGGKHEILEDTERRPMSYRRLTTAALALGQPLSRLAGPGKSVGVMLPNASAAVVTFFALQSIRRTPALLNFSTGLTNMLHGCKAAGIDVVITSRRFVEMAKMEETVAGLEAEVRIVYLEDLAKLIGKAAKLKAAIRSTLYRLGIGKSRAAANDPAVILFTSGSEGTPKGVVLSHRNLLANRYQMGAVLDFNPTDIVFNALPLFHSFGMTGGMLLPLLSGVKTFVYPSPLHYRIVPALVYDTNATIMFGTDTFLNGYARSAHAYDFYSLRYVFAGAEKVKDETRRTWSERFGIRILEGYGATETAPVIAANTPMHHRAGSVGRVLPGIDWRLEEVPGVEEGGKLHVRGPNIMLGYLKSDKPGDLQPPPGDEYDTGDIVTVSDDGFVTIIGRAKRFAKIAGEMISLNAVENHVSKLWPDHAHAVVSISDPKKGEALVLITEKKRAGKKTLSDFIRKQGGTELMVPKQIIQRDELPVLGTGKLDYVSLGKIAAGEEQK
ncbi:acyl-[ACP]--phospholipid O-acyltransferase [Alphaproteobacteria bacterium HT1-32]|nr:acyl-[ACP]--phospholipid O-acyltransferase [Alphaproteobacteria bacterium HT1-32]